jgi:DDE superfamily endonuclease
MFPLRGWCRRGGRLHANVPHGRWKTLTFVAALRCEGIDAPCVFDGPINGESFKAYVEQVLAPALRPGDVVVMDNLGSKAARSVAPFAPLVLAPCSCRLTRPISIPSSKPSQNSKHSSERPKSVLTFLRFGGHWIKRLGALPVRG